MLSSAGGNLEADQLLLIGNAQCEPTLPTNDKAEGPAIGAENGIASTLPVHHQTNESLYLSRCTRTASFLEASKTMDQGARLLP